MNLLRVGATIAWFAFAVFVGTAAATGWHDAFYPPEYMEDAYVWRVMGATLFGTIAPLFVVLLGVALFDWWTDKE